MLSEVLSLHELTSLMSAPGAAPTAKPHLSSPAETPVYGKAAMTRWLALYDRAAALQAAVREGQPVVPRVVWRAIRSLFLYEHLLSPETRRRARMTLWLREHDAPLPSLPILRRWDVCRCPQCQPHLLTGSSRLMLIAA